MTRELFMNFEHENMYESAQIEEAPIRRKGNFSPPLEKEGQGWFVKRCPNLFSVQCSMFTIVGVFPHNDFPCFPFR